MSITLDINGVRHSVEAEPDTPLLWVIRDHAGLTGTKFGCGMGLCGACTVHIDGQAIRSCSTPVSFAVDKQVTTIEGEASPAVKALQESWNELQVPQCGYCQSGQIMNAAALLAVNAMPSDSDIDSAMSGNICRCATYPRIKQGIKQAAEKLG